MKIFGINITFGDPEKKRRKRAETEAEEQLHFIVRFSDIRQDKIKDGRYYPWWKSNIDQYADLIINSKKDDEVKDLLISKFCAYLRKREMDIELKNDELKAVADKIRTNTK